MLFILLGVAFLTLLERNYLGFSQLRISPNKRIYLGLLQPVLDGLKLLSKINLVPDRGYALYFFLSPLIFFIFLFLEWQVIPYLFCPHRIRKRLLFLLTLVGALVYFLLLSGLMRVRKYGILGSLRGSRQSISFELVFFFILFIIMIIYRMFSLSQEFFFIKIFFLLPLIFLLILTELGRAPVDFIERERELVSGYNVEFGRVLFVLLFLSEYGFLIFFSILLRVIFFSSNVLINYLIISVILLIRSTYPRGKFDHLMGLYWYTLLPFSMWILLVLYIAVVEGICNVLQLSLYIEICFLVYYKILITSYIEENYPNLSFLTVVKQSISGKTNYRYFLFLYFLLIYNIIVYFCF